MGRDELVADLWKWLGRTLGRQGETGAHDPTGIALAGNLSQVASHDDMEAWYLVAIANWLRSQLDRRGESEDALARSLAAFALVLPVAPQLVPEEARALLWTGGAGEQGRLAAAEAADSWHTRAVELLRDDRTREDEAALTRVIGLLRAAVTATPAGHPHRAKYLSKLGVALRQRFGRTGDRLDLDEAIALEQKAGATSPTPESGGGSDTDTGRSP